METFVLLYLFYCNFCFIDGDTWLKKGVDGVMRYDALANVTSEF